MTLTHAGHEFQRHAERILNAVASAEEALSVRPEALGDQVVIGAVPLLTGYYLPALLARYRRAFLNVRMWVYEDSGTLIEHQLINGELDAALMITSTLESPSSFDSLTLIRSPWCVWAPVRHRLAGLGAVSIGELRGETVVELRNEELERAAGDLWRRSGHDRQ